jgi:hypothetical protein
LNHKKYFRLRFMQGGYLFVLEILLYLYQSVFFLDIELKLGYNHNMEGCKIRLWAARG